jgi:prevent-host-death family protein
MNTTYQQFIGAFQAKTQFSQLIERVLKGESITITRHSQPVAKLVPVGRSSREQVAELFKKMDAFRESLRSRPRKPGDTASLKDLINKGRRI